MTDALIRSEADQLVSSEADRPISSEADRSLPDGMTLDGIAKVTKRDGRVVPFDREKIVIALERAGAATSEFGPNQARELTDRVVVRAETTLEQHAPDIESIQDIVENVLLESRYKATAKAYILYRDQHKCRRQISDTYNVNLVDDYLRRSDWRVNENSNMSYSLQGLNNFLASELSKTYWLQTVYSPKVREAHVSGDFHIHDLALLSVYCVGWDLYDLLAEGFKGVEGKVESRPAKHFRSALGQMVNFFYTLQGEASGAQAFSNVDTLLAPFIRFDNYSYQDVKQALQEFLFNVNVPTRVGFQTPFTNMTLDLECPKHLRDTAVVCGGELRNETYGEFQEEMSMFNQAFLEVMAEGDAKGRVFTFPIPTYNITEDFDWDNPAHDPLWAVTAKYGLPYFSNFINSDMSPEDARSMCCRLRIDNRELEYRGGGLFGANPLTGSVGIVTINLPRIGREASSREEFFSKLEHLMDLASESLEVKRKTLEQLTESGLYPYTTYYLRNIKARTGKYWANHFSTIGLIGMHEAIREFADDDEGILSVDGQQFAGEVLNFMRERTRHYKELTGHNYNLEATPAEGTTYRFASIDQQRSPGAIFGNGQGEEVESPFYTNSTHVPVGYSTDVFAILDHQDELQALYTGGTVVHLFVGERIDDPRSVKRLVRKVCENYKLPYFTVTPTFSVCPEHGYVAGEHAQCEKCGKSCEVYSRVVGYMRPVNQWNSAKKSEFTLRSTVDVDAAAKSAATTRSGVR